MHVTGCAGTLLRAWLALRRHSGRGAAAGETCPKRGAGLNNRTLVLKTVPLDDLNLLKAGCKLLADGNKVVDDH